MTNVIPQEVLKIYKKLEKENYLVFFVGGSVRDLMLKRAIKDWDLTTNATPKEILKLFPNAFYDNSFGTVGIPYQSKENKYVVEVTTFRKEGAYKDNRHPEIIEWGKTIEEDLARRDFTINAIALKLVGDNNSFEIIDPYFGEKDLKKKLIKAVGNASLRFKEDALRLMRGVRIATELEFTIEKETFEKIAEDAKLINHVSSERIQIELLKILASKHPYDGIMLLKDLGLLEFILPELMDGIEFSQVRPGRHHTTDVFTHNLMALKFCPSNDPIVRFAALLHDVGKPKAARKDKDGLVIFHNHEVTGAKIADKICERLKFSKIEKDRIVSLIRWHMFGVNENQTDSAIRRFLRKIGTENVKDMMDIRVADRLGSGRPAESWRFKLFRQKVEEQLKPAKFSINDLAIDGNDIMRILKIKPGSEIGKILQTLFEEVDKNLELNNKDYLENKILELGKKLL